MNGLLLSLPFIDSINCKKLMDGKKLEKKVLPVAKVFEFEDLQ